MSNRIQHAFDQIHADERLKQDTMAAVNRRAYQNTKRRNFLFRPIPVVCSLLIVSMIGLASYFTPISAISIDINPSIELKLNAYNRVIQTTAYGPQAEQVLSSLDLINHTYTDAISQMMESNEMAKYLTNDTDVSVTVLSPNQQKYEEITQGVSGCMHQNVSCHQADSELVKAAEEANLSFGKYRAYLQLQQTHPEITIEEVRHMSMYEIQQLIDGETDVSSGQQQNQQGMGQNNGHHNGHHHGQE